MAPATSVARIRKQMFDRVERGEATVVEACGQYRLSRSRFSSCDTATARTAKPGCCPSHARSTDGADDDLARTRTFQLPPRGSCRAEVMRPHHSSHAPDRVNVESRTLCTFRIWYLANYQLSLGVERVTVDEGRSGKRLYLQQDPTAHLCECSLQARAVGITPTQPISCTPGTNGRSAILGVLRHGGSVVQASRF